MIVDILLNWNFQILTKFDIRKDYNLEGKKNLYFSLDVIFVKG